MNKRKVIATFIILGILILFLVLCGFIAYRYLISPMQSLLKMPNSLSTPRVLVGSDFLSKQVFIQVPQLGSVTDIKEGKLDPHIGVEIGIAGSRGAIFLDKSGAEKASVMFSQKNAHVEIIDVNADGICEFMNRGSWSCDASLIDHDGHTIWTYGGDPGVNDMCGGDMDGDGRFEFVVGFNGNGGVHLLDQDGKLKWKRTGGNVWDVDLADVYNNGKLEIIHPGGFGEIIIGDGLGNILGSIKTASLSPRFSICRWPTQKSREYVLSSGKDFLFLSDFGKPITRLKAPLSGDLSEARGVSAKIRGDQSEYFSVIEAFKQWNRSVLYVFDSKGVLVYQEILPETCESIAAITLEKTGNESILLGGVGEIWQYKLRLQL
jgi:hypothetical protein